MKTPPRLRAALAALSLAAFASSCALDDWDDDYGTRRGPRYGRYDDYDGYGRREPPPRHDGTWDRRGDGRRDDGRRDAAPRIPKGFVRAGSFSAGGAVECGIPTSRTIKKILLAGTSGTVSVNTVVLREGAAKTSYPLAVRLAPGQTREIDLGGARRATGIRVSSGGKGTFEVYVH